MVGQDNAANSQRPIEVGASCKTKAAPQRSAAGRLEFRSYWLLTVTATEALSVREPLVPVTVTV